MTMPCAKAKDTEKSLFDVIHLHKYRGVPV